MPSRAIAPNEADVIRWLLDHAHVGDVAVYRNLGIEQMHVVGGCDCGCLSLEFESDAWTGAEIIAEGLAVYSDHEQAEIILWGRDNRIVLLEIVDSKAPRFPDISELRTWEQRGSELV